MPQVNTIVELYNEKLKAGKLSGHLFQRGKFFGLVTTYLKDALGETAEPVVIGLDGETGEAFLDDSLPFQLYHRIAGVNYSSDNFGENPSLISTYNMVCVVFADKMKLRKHESDLAFMIRSDMQKRLTTTELGTSGLSSASVVFTGANFDQSAVFQNEYKSQGWTTDPEHLYFSLNYTLTVDAQPNCVTCEDCE